MRRMPVLAAALCLRALSGCVLPPFCETNAQGELIPALQAPTESDALTVSPTAVTIVTGGTVMFFARGSGIGNTNVAWGIEEKDGGSISYGNYVAPEKPGVYHVIARKQVFESRWHGESCGFTPSSSVPKPELVEDHLARATVTVVPPYLAISPSWAVVLVNSTTGFGAVSNLKDKGPVSWYLAEGTAGTVKSPDQNALFFTANEHPGTFHIRAWLQERPEIDAYLAVTVATAPDPVTGP